MRRWKISLRIGPWGPEPLVGMGGGEAVLCLLGRQGRTYWGLPDAEVALWVSTGTRDQVKEREQSRVRNREMAMGRDRGMGKRGLQLG